MALADEIRETRRAINDLVAGAQSATISTPTGTRSYTRPMLRELRDHLEWLMRRYSMNNVRKRVCPDFSGISNALLAALALGLATASPCVSRADLTPEMLTITWARTDAVVTVANTYLTGSQLLLTNCQALASSGAAQDLTGLGGYVKVGNSVTSLTYQITAQDATNGTFTAALTLPTAAQMSPTNLTYSTLLLFYTTPVPDTYLRLQLSLTNATTAFTYLGDRKLATRSALP
jgi:hypothetical protein